MALTKVQSGVMDGGLTLSDSAPANTLVTTSAGNVGFSISNTAAKVNTLLSGTAVSGNTTGSTVGASNIFQLSSNNWSATNSTVFLLGGGSSSNPGQISSGIGFSRQNENDWGTQLKFYTHQTTTDVLDSLNERMRIDASGNVLFGTTSTNTGNGCVFFRSDGTGAYWVNATSTSASWDHYTFKIGTTTVGRITTSGSSTSYQTSSDYRLKENIAPMTGALDKVALLKPCTYTWKVDGSDGQGFIAHELQAVVPDCVTGEKDAVETYLDEDGVEQTRPKYQGIDTSFLVATLTAAIQEQQAIITDLKSRIEALEAK